MKNRQCGQNFPFNNTIITVVKKYVVSVCINFEEHGIQVFVHLWQIYIAMVVVRIALSNSVIGLPVYLVVSMEINRLGFV